MKTFTTFALAMILSVVALAQNYEQIPLSEITKIANRNAEALWGECFPAEPIPYYGQDDKIIAWRFNYSIGVPFPEREKIISDCRHNEDCADRYLQWGGDNYGRILIAARNNMPVMLEYSKCLSAEFALHTKFAKLSSKAFSDGESVAGKIYYLNHFNTWQEISDGKEIKYICTSPTGGIKSQTEFENKKNESGYFCETGDFDKLWAKYQNGFVVSNKADKYIPDHQYMPFYDWSYGCSPTAAAMLFAWYDNRSAITDYKYSCFVNWHYQRWDSLENQTDYNVSNLQKDLAIAMHTDTLTGNTSSYDLDNGMQHVANSQRGYNFDIEDYFTFLWTRTKNDIDDGRPLIVSIPGHSTTGVGYNNSSDVAITHYTHDPPEHLVYVSRWSIDMTVRAKKGGGKGAHVKLISPYGDPRYSRNGQGEVYNEGNWAEILWEADEVEDSYVDIRYSTDGGYNFLPVIFDFPNTGLYNWQIPAGVNSTKCRVIINLYDPELEPYYAGADGSWGNFKINAGGAIATMSDGHLYENERVSKFYLHQHPHSSWSVIASHTDTLGDHWQMQLFDGEDFNDDPIKEYVYGRYTNFIALDGNHLASQLRGVKHKPYSSAKTNYLQYEGGNDELELTSGGTVQVNWQNDEIVRVYDIHLTPGQYFFRMKRLSGDLDIDMAFMSSADGSYIKDISQAEYISENVGGEEDSYIVNIETEDDYGFCMFAKKMGSGLLSLKIDDAYIWTGNENSNWHNGDNWVGGTVPPWGSDVAIPNRSNDPNIYTAEAHCGSLRILQGAHLTLTNYNLVIQDDLSLDGTISVDNPSLDVFCGGDVEVLSHGNLDIIDNAMLWVEGDWTFEEGAYTNPNSGTVKFWGTQNSIIHVKSANCRFNNLRISKTSGAWVAYDNCPDMEPLKIYNQFIIDDGAEFIQWAMYNTIFEGSFLAYPGSEFHFVNGQAIFDYAGTGGISINSEPGSYFNDLTASCTNWLGLSSDIEIRGDLTINEGNFKTLGYDVYIKGDWNDEAWGFNHGSSRVIFNGSGTQTSYGGAFWELELNKPSGELRIRENTTGVQHYDWTQGIMRVNGGYFLALDCEDSGLYGSITVSSGTADFRQDPGQYFDMNANLAISGGELHLHGGNGMGFWPFSNNASITMSDGLIDIHDYGIRIHNSTTYTLDEDITGGIIRINGSLHIHNDDFNPTGGTIQMIGYNEDASLHSVVGANLFNLVVDKSSKKNKAIAANLVATGYVDINGDFTLDGGNFEAPSTLCIQGQFNNNLTPSHFDELTGTVIFDGADNNEFENDEVFYNLIVDKPSDYFIINEGVSLGVNGTFTVDEGIAYFMPGSEITLGNALEVNYGGTLVLEGNDTDYVSVNQGTSKANYSFDINPGGEIAAIHTIFIFMDLEGINIHSGAYVWPEGAFHNCNFAYGLPGGTAMTIDNGADLVIHDAYFLPNTTGMAHNVTKNVDNGTVFFDGAVGDFSGSDFENDPYNRIHWEYIPPFELPFAENWDSGDFESNIWTATSENWFVDANNGNDEPSAGFKFTPRIYNYSEQLRSYQLNGVPHSTVQLSYDIAFEDWDPVTLEQLSVRLVYPNADYYTLANYDNSAGTFDFISETIDISEYAAGEIFMISFVAHGEDSWSIEKWNIDNIVVSGIPEEPGKLLGTVKDAMSENPIQDALAEIIGTAFSMITDENGEFNIVDVPPGFYTVKINADGYLSKTINNVEIKAEENTFLTILLTPEPPSYCTQNLYQYGCAEGDGINTFILQDIVNEESGCSANGFGDFTTLSTDLTQGYPYPLQLSSNYENQYVSVWIDLNDNFEFEETEKMLADFLLEIGNETYSAVLEIPDLAPLGVHRLRARAVWSLQNTNPCDYYSFGEVEDYTVNITNESALGGLKAFVFDNLQKASIASARVEIMGTGQFAYTEEEGYCIIDFIEPGKYDIQVSANGYETLTLTAQYIFPNMNNLIEIELVPLAILSHNISLTEGWQGLSSYLMPSESDIETIFGPIGNQMTLVYNYEQMYWPNAGIATLTNWDHHDAFFIKMQEGATLNITGYAEANLSCDVPASWSILPVICPDDVSLTELFDGKAVKDNVVLIKEIAGTGVYWPEYNINSLGVLHCGKAYNLLMETADQITFPEAPTKATSNVKAWEYPNIFGFDKPIKTASSHLIVFPEHAFEQLNFNKENLIVAKTSEGLVCGMTPIKGNSALTIYGDDQTTFGKDGFFEGEHISFSVVNPQTLQEQTLQITFEESWANHGGKFESNGVSVVKDAVSGTTGLANELSKSVNIYPNPTHGKFVIDGLDESTTIEIFDAGGQVILQKTISPIENHLDLTGVEKGVYNVRLISSNGTFTKRIVLL